VYDLEIEIKYNLIRLRLRFYKDPTYPVKIGDEEGEEYIYQ